MGEMYAPTQVECSLGGRAMNDWTKIEVSQASDDYDTKVATRGQVAAVRIHDPRREVKITVLKTSPTNDMLSALRKTGMSAAASAFASIFSLRDMGGTSVLTGKSFIKRPPDRTYSNTVDEQTWTLTVVSDEQAEVFGGNSTF
jgi:hypothetical protein